MISLIKQNKILDQVRQKAKEDETANESFDDYEVSIDEIDFIPMCFMDLDVSARTQHAIIYFNSKLLEDSDVVEKLMPYFIHEVQHYLQQTTGDGPTEGSSDDESYLDNENEISGFQAQTKYISRNESPEKAEQYVEKVLEHHSVPESEKEEKKEDLLRTSSFEFGKAIRSKKYSFECFNCGTHFNAHPDLVFKVRGKDICKNCYNKMIEYRKTIPCTCGHMHDEHSLKEGERHTGKYHCNAIIIPENYRSTPKKCPCENYKPSQDDYSDANDFLRKGSFSQKIKNLLYPPLTFTCYNCEKNIDVDKELIGRIRGKILCEKCYHKFLEYRKNIPCKCGHLQMDHDKKSCNHISEKLQDDFALTKCDCKKYQPSQDDYSDASDGKQLSLEFEKRDKSLPRTENIQELKERVMHEIETGEEFKRKEKYRPRPSLNLIRKEHPYKQKHIADLARRVMEATEKKDDNSSSDAKQIETDKRCDYCNQRIQFDIDLNYIRGKLLCRYDYAEALDKLIEESTITPCHKCGHSIQDHNGIVDDFHKGPRKYLGKGRCSVLLDSNYRSVPKQCSCESYV